MGVEGTEYTKKVEISSIKLKKEEKGKVVEFNGRATIRGYRVKDDDYCVFTAVEKKPGKKNEGGYNERADRKQAAVYLNALGMENKCYGGIVISYYTVK